MDTPAPLITPSFAERIAWLHEPVRLRGVLLPWFLRVMLEQALHSLFCTLERALLTLWDLHQQGKLVQPVPSDELTSEPLPASKPIYPHMAAPKRRAVDAAMRAARSARGQDADAWVLHSLAQTVCIMPPWWWLGELHGDGAMRDYRGSQVEWLCDRPPKIGCGASMVCRAAEMRRETCVQIVPVS